MTSQWWEIRMSVASEFISEMIIREKWNNVFKVLEEKDGQPRIPCPGKYPSGINGKWKETKRFCCHMPYSKRSDK